jgi:cytochrome P450
MDRGELNGGSLPFPGAAADFLANPYPVFQRLRAESPILAHGGSVFLSRYKDIAAILRDERFGRRRPAKPAVPHAVALAETPVEGLAKLAKMRRQSEQAPLLWMSNQDPPEHTRLRALMAPAFSPARLAPLGARIQAMADALLDAVQPSGRMDIVADYAYRLPVWVISEIMGVPPSDRERLDRWARDYSRYFDLKRTRVAHERMLLARAGFSEYARGRLAEPGQGERSELVNALLGAHTDGALSTDELLANFGLLFFAGHETTATLISNGVLALLRHPDQLRRLQDEPALIASAVEEFLRYDTPTPLISRIARADAELDGHTFRKGERLILVLAAANRDPERFSEPDRLDLGRTPNPHLTFGQGIHYCLGAHLARLEAQIALSTIVRRLPDMALEDRPLVWAPSLELRRLSALPVRF